MKCIRSAQLESIESYRNGRNTRREQIVKRYAGPGNCETAGGHRLSEFLFGHRIRADEAASGDRGQSDAPQFLRDLLCKGCRVSASKGHEYGVVGLLTLHGISSDHVLWTEEERPILVYSVWEQARNAAIDRDIRMTLRKTQ